MEVFFSSKKTVIDQKRLDFVAELKGPLSLRKQSPGVLSDWDSENTPRSSANLIQGFLDSFQTKLPFVLASTLFCSLQ